MRTTSRFFAPALLAALLSGQAASGIVLVHVASHHAPEASRTRPETSHAHHVHHAGTERHHHAADRPADPAADHARDHGHELAATAATAPARVAGPAFPLQPLATLPRGPHLDLPDVFAAPGRLLLLLRVGPPGPARHPILLL